MPKKDGFPGSAEISALQSPYIESERSGVYFCPCPCSFPGKKYIYTMSYRQTSTQQPQRCYGFYTSSTMRTLSVKFGKSHCIKSQEAQTRQEEKLLVALDRATDFYFLYQIPPHVPCTLPRTSNRMPLNSTPVVRLKSSLEFWSI